MIFLPLAAVGVAAAGIGYYLQTHAAVVDDSEAVEEDEEGSEPEGDTSVTVTAKDLRAMSKEDRIIAVLAAARAALAMDDYEGDKDDASVMIAAHAARETGWYIHTARTASSESNNLFGITATTGQDHVEGNDAGNMRSFARYSDIAEGVAAYVDLIRRLYPVAFERLDSRDPRGYAWALKYGGKRQYYELDYEGFARPLENIYKTVEAYA